MHNFRIGEFVVTAEGTGEVVGIPDLRDVLVILDRDEALLSTVHSFPRDQVWSCDS